ncbi:hypothetical protein AUL54_13750 [Bacillus sp. SDLI1]|uniref:Uncharacterized protein n=1 Tax=Bacillus siamensis TaxID=659243 RepID=A0AAI8HKY6_9BACI|nr:hypothetical protein AUL54_13750 [Bacillus sp. SDLI1]AUJ75908.1 hypothetical protein CWD84_03220 [Bacillus siamensis]
MSKKIRTSSLTNETYYRMSQRAYNYDYLKRKLENNEYIRLLEYCFRKNSEFIAIVADKLRLELKASKMLI